MKLTGVKLYPAGAHTSVDLSFRDPTSQNPFQVRGIDGLDADQIVPRSYGSSLGSANRFYDFTLQKRDIVILIGLNPNLANSSSYSELRDQLFRVISSSRTGFVLLQFTNGTNVVATISGFVSKFETPQFTQNPEVRITISCDDPMLRAPTPVNVNFALSPTNNILINDLMSTAPHGLKFRLKVNDTIPQLIFADETAKWAFKVKPSGGFVNDDIFWFSSEYNNKYLYFVRGGTTYQLGDAVVTNSVWPIIFPGQNHLKCEASLDWLAVSYYPTYWGV